MTTRQRTGKTLPADFAQGLAEALFQMYGPNYKALLFAHLHDECTGNEPGTDTVHHDNPLLEHLGGDRISRPVDYALLRCTFNLHALWYVRFPRAASNRTYRIGRDWWDPQEAYASTSVIAHPYALQHILGPDVSAALREMELVTVPKIEPEEPGASDWNTFDERFRTWIHQQQHIRHQNWHHKVRVACRVLAQRLQQRGGIACHTRETRDTITLAFPVCPFCANERATCGVFRGVVDGMLVWLHQRARQQHQERSYETIAVLTTDQLRLDPDPDDWHRLTLVLAPAP